MPITSYAQNFEDVMLARAFPGASGFYVDVGANDPDIDNVTRVFYERGWSGINIEPLSVNSEEIRKKRPRDINLEMVVGEQEGDQDQKRAEVGESRSDFGRSEAEQDRDEDSEQHQPQTRRWDRQCHPIGTETLVEY